jgi:hypothetical protein
MAVYNKQLIIDLNRDRVNNCRIFNKFNNNK